MKEKMNPELDALLKSESQQAISKFINELPDENLSMAWRSSLNERLRGTEAVPRWKLRLGTSWRPAVGLALATCLAIAVTLRTPQTVRPAADSNLEASLVSTYDDSVNSETVAGAGLSVHEVSDTTSTSNSSSDWSESDLNSL